MEYHVYYILIPLSRQEHILFHISVILYVFSLGRCEDSIFYERESLYGKLANVWFLDNSYRKPVRQKSWCIETINKPYRESMWKARFLAAFLIQFCHMIIDNVAFDFVVNNIPNNLYNYITFYNIHYQPSNSSNYKFIPLFIFSTLSMWKESLPIIMWIFKKLLIKMILSWIIS